MAAVEIRKGIYWVGSVDWEVRNFHGYSTPQGTTYNAYLIVDEKIVLIDTVKKELFDQMFYRISQIIDPAKIDILLSNHSELDHSGSLPKMKEVAPHAKIITSKRGEKALQKHFHKDWDLQVVDSGDTLNIGKRTLSFIATPLVHWPDSMVTYLADDKVLFSNDAFGQHLATSQRYDDEIGWSILQRDAAKYYANIVLPYGKQVNKAFSSLAALDIKTICTSHGIMWRSFIPKIMAEYRKWANHQTQNQALIIYDTMWKSTAKMAQALEMGLVEAGVPVTIRNLKVNHISDIMTDVLSTKLILLGSPTLNNSVLPTVAQFLNYLKGLKPQNRIGFAFGSYGWGGQAVGEIESVFEALKWEIALQGIKIEYVPGADELETVKKTGHNLGKVLLKNAMSS